MKLSGYIYTKTEVLEKFRNYACNKFCDDLYDVDLRFWNNESACGFAILNNGEKRYIFINF